MGKAKYPKYKPSKTPWQEQIPSHWQETELRMLFADNKNKNIGLVERNLLSLSYGKLKRKDIDNATGLVPASFEGYQIIDEGYIVLRFTDLQNDKKSLRVGYVNEKGIITNAYIGLAPKADIHSKYFYYQLHFLDKIKYFYNLGGGVRQSLAFKEFSRETVLVPAKSEQTKITAFLDFKLSKIERFIRKKKELIKKLEEQKYGIVSRAITKGILPSVPMKDTGIDWIGTIPKHWGIMKLKYLAKIKTGGTPKIESSNLDYFENGIVNWYTPGDFSNEGFLYNSKRKVNSIAVEKNQIEIYPANSVYLISIGGTIGKVGYSQNAGSCNQQINAIMFNKKINPLFGFYFLKSSKYQIDLLADFTTLPILNQTKAKEIIVSFPLDPNEQISIVSFIQNKLNEISTVILKIQKEIELTEEYKTSIIAEAVTGKIDVRNYTIKETIDEVYGDAEEEELSIAAEDNTEYQSISE